MADYADRVNKLMAKAESTEFPEEAEAFLAKAQELMTEYSIDEAMLRAARPGEAVEEIAELKLVYTGGMRKVLYRLGIRLAEYNGCRSFFTDKRHAKPRNITVTVIGFPKDLERIELLDMSLKLQCAVALKKFVKENVDPQWHRGYKRNEKREFVLGFTDGVGVKLRVAEENAIKEAAEAKGTGVELAIRSRKDQVDDWTDTNHPGLRAVRSRIQRGSATAKRQGVDQGMAANTNTDPGLRQQGALPA
jgi:hypothetical protein